MVKSKCNAFMAALLLLCFESINIDCLNPTKFYKISCILGIWFSQLNLINPCLVLSLSNEQLISLQNA